MPTELTIAELRDGGERDLGVSDWWTVEQEHIGKFAEATGDHQWIHVDPERAAKGPFGTTIAHGYLSLSLLPRLLDDLIEVTDASAGINYGIDRVRFTNPVPSGSRVRLKAKVLEAQERGGGVQYKVGAEVEIEGKDRPALVGEVIYLALP